jgi:hypothetical protein
MGQALRNPWRIAAIVLGFIAWWPIGLAMLVLLKGPLLLDRFGAWPWQGERSRRATAGSGNTAFDEYRDGVLRRLEEERRALEQDRQAFGEFLDQLKRAKDREEFDRFMAGRHPGQA